MDSQSLQRAFTELSAAAVADACLRVGLPLRVAPAGIRPLLPTYRLAGRVVPVKHYGSVDIFLEAVEGAAPGDVLLIDNGGRTDEGCIGDLTTLEVQAAGLGGIVVWGAHRDTAELVEMGYPFFSYHACPAGPQRVEPREADALTRARCGPLSVGRDDVAFADADGLLFTPLEGVEQVLEAAAAIRETERRQAEAVKAGRGLREQLRFAEYLETRAKQPSYSFREHLRAVGGAIEE